MRLARWVAAGLLLGCLVGFLVALLRPRGILRRPGVDSVDMSSVEAASPSPAGEGRH